MGTEYRFHLHTSSLLAFILSLFAVGVLMVLCALSIPRLFCVVVALGVLGLTTVHIRRDAWLLAATSCLVLRLDDSGRVSLLLRNGYELTGQICGDTLVLPWLVVVNMKDDLGVRRSVLLLPDSLSEEDFRRLRVQLRHGVRRHA